MFFGDESKVDRKDSIMKGKKLFYFVLFFSLIVILYGCSGRNSRAYLEDRIGNQISRVYPTKNLEDLFEQFPNGFLIEQSYLFEDRIIDFELEGIEKGKPLEGTIKKINRKSGAEEEKIPVKYYEGKFLYDNEEAARKLLPVEKFLFQKMTLNKEILSKFKLKKTHYNDNNGSFDLEYVVKNEQINQFLDLDNQQQVTLGFHGSNANRSYYYSLSVEIGSNLMFIERISD